MFVLDSNTISYYFRNEPCVVQELQAISPNHIAVPAIVVYELKYGLLRLPPEACKPRMQALEKFLRFMTILPFDESAAGYAARVRSELEQQGTPIGTHDILIAATTLAVQGTLVTRNVREFSRVSGLSWVNWHNDASV
jgi:tRNA(fMet)-specific endonuclease VapC